MPAVSLGVLPRCRLPGDQDVSVSGPNAKRDSRRPPSSLQKGLPHRLRRRLRPIDQEGPPETAPLIAMTAPAPVRFSGRASHDHERDIIVPVRLTHEGLDRAEELVRVLRGGTPGGFAQAAQQALVAEERVRPTAVSGFKAARPVRPAGACDGSALTVGIIDPSSQRGP
jgi:hypothetical protein